MNHKLTVSRLFDLGSYKNIRVEAETNEINDEQWHSAEFMDEARINLAHECFMNFVLVQELAARNAEQINSHEWQNLYEELRANRHPESYEIDIPAPEVVEDVVEYD